MVTPFLLPYVGMSPLQYRQQLFSECPETPRQIFQRLQ